MSDAKTDGIFNLTVPVTMSFPNLFEAKAIGPKGKESGTPKFTANFLFKPDSDDLKGLKALAVKAAKARWPGRDLKELKFPFINGDTSAEKAKAKGKDRDFERGHVVVNAKSKYEPRLSGIENGKMIDYEGDARIKAKPKFYPGVLVLAQFNIQAYDGVGANPDGVTAYLNLVFTTNKGARLATAGGASAAEAFKGYVGSASTEDPTGGTDLDDEIPF